MGECKVLLYSFNFFFLTLRIGDFTEYRKAAFPYSIAAQETQNIFSWESVPEGFVLSDPDHLKASQIDALYNHWLKRQSKGLKPFVILNSIPQHAGLKKKMSKKAQGKRKMDYVEVDTEDGDVASEAGISGGEGKSSRGGGKFSGDDGKTEKSTPPKFGPPVGK